MEREKLLSIIKELLILIDDDSLDSLTDESKSILVELDLIELIDDDEHTTELMIDSQIERMVSTEIVKNRKDKIHRRKKNFRGPNPFKHREETFAVFIDRFLLMKKNGEPFTIQEAAMTIGCPVDRVYRHFDHLRHHHNVILEHSKEEWRVISMDSMESYK